MSAPFRISRGFKLGLWPRWKPHHFECTNLKLSSQVSKVAVLHHITEILHMPSNQVNIPGLMITWQIFHSPIWCYSLCEQSRYPDFLSHETEHGFQPRLSQMSWSDKPGIHFSWWHQTRIGDEISLKLLTIIFYHELLKAILLICFNTAARHLCVVESRLRKVALDIKSSVLGIRMRRQYRMGHFGKFVLWVGLHDSQCSTRSTHSDPSNQIWIRLIHPFRKRSRKFKISKKLPIKENCLVSASSAGVAEMDEEQFVSSSQSIRTPITLYCPRTGYHINVV